jgi:hypothetical protein
MFYQLTNGMVAAAGLRTDAAGTGRAVLAVVPDVAGEPKPAIKRLMSGEYYFRHRDGDAAFGCGCCGIHSDRPAGACRRAGRILKHAARSEDADATIESCTRVIDDQEVVPKIRSTALFFRSLALETKARPQGRHGRSR